MLVNRKMIIVVLDDFTKKGGVANLVAAPRL